MNKKQTIRERSQSKKARPVIQCDLDGNEITRWKSAYQVSKFSDWKMQWQTIGKCALGKLLTAYGYIWKYENTS